MPEQSLTTYYSLLGLHGIKGKPAEVLFEKNPIVRMMPVLPSNEKMGHSGSRLSSMPAPTFRKVSGYTTPGVATWSPFTEDISIVDGSCLVPQDVIRIEGWQKMIYAERAHRQGFIQAIAGHWFNGDVVTAPEKYRSLNERYKTPDNDTASNSPEDPDTSTAAQVNVYDNGGSGSDTCSMWFIRPGPEQVHAITPTGDPQMGIVEVDDGLIVQWSGATKRKVYSKTWEWWHGLAVPDQRCVARLRNIESGLDSISSDMILNIFRILNEGMTSGTGTIWIFIPPRLKTHFDWLAVNKQNVWYSRENPWGANMLMWNGEYPILTCDKLTLTETAVAAV